MAGRAAGFAFYPPTKSKSKDKMRKCDFSHKKVVLFATSGSSDMGKTAEKLQPFLGSEAEIVDAKVMNENPSLEALKAWAVY